MVPSSGLRIQFQQNCQVPGPVSTQLFDQYCCYLIRGNENQKNKYTDIRDILGPTLIMQVKQRWKSLDAGDNVWPSSGILCSSASIDCIMKARKS